MCCTTPNVTALHTSCEPYSVIGLLLQHWPVDLEGSLSDPVTDALLALDKWGLQRLDLSGNSITGPVPAGITRMKNLYELLLGDNCE